MPTFRLQILVLAAAISCASGCAMLTPDQSGPGRSASQADPYDPADYNFIDTFERSNRSTKNPPIGLADEILPTQYSESSLDDSVDRQSVEPLPVDVASTRKDHASVLDTLIQDQVNFYSRDNLCLFVPVLGVSATLAHTSFDQEFANAWQEDVRSDFTDDLAKFSKEFGEQWTVVPVYVSASLLGRTGWFDPRLQTWGDRSFRSMLVGVPPLLFAQRAIGSSRPNDIPPDSNWHFWNDENGASGHTFVGAVPFLVAAQLAERDVCRVSLYAASTLTGLSRINDNDHYASQVLMGWFIAYAATKSTQQTDEQGVQVFPLRIGKQALGLGFEKRY